MQDVSPEELKAFRTRARPGSFAARLDEADLAGLLGRGVRKNYKRNMTLFRQSEDGDLAGFILSGTVKISVVAGDGREIAFAYLGPGDAAGEISALDGRPRTATGVVVEPAEIVVITRRDLLAYFADHPSAAMKAIDYLCDRLRETNALLETGRAYETETRLARAVLRLLREHGAGPESARVRFRLSQSDLGAFASVSRENVNRTLKDWETAGFIAIESGQVVVRDREALEEIACLEE